MKFILKQNILRGDALTFLTDNDEPIVFSEWSTVNGSMTKRRDFTLNNLLGAEAMKGDGGLFEEFYDTDPKLYRFDENGYISFDKLEKNHSFVNDWKIFIPYASPGNDSYPHLILSKPIVAGVNTCCTETYLIIGLVSSEIRAKNIAQYMVTSFFRFMVLLAKSTQHITQKTYVFVPMQNFDETWTDERLYQKYGITKEEQEFIDTLIRPMDITYE